MIRGDTTTIPYEIEPLGEKAVLIRFGDTIDLKVHHSVMAVHQKLEGLAFAGWIEAVPSYTAITVHYDPVLVYKSRNMKEQCHETIFETIRTRLCTLLDDCAAALSTQDVKEGKLAQQIIIPVCYGGEYGPDLALVAEYCRMSEEEVIRLHSSSEYLVYMIGFAPGFPYLGGMDEKIAMPRRSEPRANTPAGSVGIAGAQTGVYPYATPGGWQIIGRSPLKLFDPEQEQPSYLRAGQQIRFEPISLKEYKALAKDEWGDNA